MGWLGVRGKSGKVEMDAAQRARPMARRPYPMNGGDTAAPTFAPTLSGMAKLRVRPSNSKKHSPFLSWVRRKETVELSPTKVIKRENADLLWAALRVLCYKRRWPNGIPSAKLFPEDRFSPRERLLHQDRQVVAAANCKRTCWRRPLVRILKYPKNGPNFTTMAA